MKEDQLNSVDVSEKKEQWHRAFDELFPNTDAVTNATGFWEALGHENAAQFLENFDRSQPVLPQLTKLLTKACQERGENASFQQEGDQLIVHTDCHWFDWYKGKNAESACRAGCDCWFQTIVGDINENLGTRLEVQTVLTQADQSHICKRVFGEITGFVV